MRILLLNGPNLGTLGTREPEIYGTTTLAEIVAAARERAGERGATLADFQSNHEGALIDRLEQRDFDGVVINAGALTHYGYSLYDALVACGRPVVEIHISDLAKRAEREPWRRTNAISAAARAQVMGKGWRGYLEAVDHLCDLMEGAP
jgi:3-dehydroquinate dehydratase-2